MVEVEQDTRRRKSLGFAVVIAAVAAAGMVHLEMERVAEICRHLDCEERSFQALYPRQWHCWERFDVMLLIYQLVFARRVHRKNKKLCT